MVHCLAGAHRAGTTGVSYVMKAAELNMRDALLLTQQRRSIVNPIGGLSDLLGLLDVAYKIYGRKSVATVSEQTIAQVQVTKEIIKIKYNDQELVIKTENQGQVYVQTKSKFSVNML